MSRSQDNQAQAGTGKRRRFSVDALFTDHRPQAAGVEDLATAKVILLDRIIPDPDQPRRTFDQEKLDELAASIRIEGVLQPIVVRYDDLQDTYVVIHGERRWRAARLAGLDRLPAVVRDVPPERRLIQQLMENIVRDDLNAVDRAAALRTLKVQLEDAPWDEVAKAVGIRRSRLFQLLGTEKLPEQVQDDIRAGRLSEKQSRTFQGLPPAAQEALRIAVVEDGIAPAESARLAKALRGRDLPDDPLGVMAVVRELRAGSASAATRQSAQATGADRHSPERQRDDAPVAFTDDDVIALLGAISAAAGGGERERDVLRHTADVLAAPRFDQKRLRKEVLALAQTLSRAPEVIADPEDPNYLVLQALRDALSGLLSPPTDSSRR